MLDISHADIHNYGLAFWGVSAAGGPGFRALLEVLLEHGGENRLRNDPLFGDEYVRVDAKALMRLVATLLRERDAPGNSD